MILYRLLGNIRRAAISALLIPSSRLISKNVPLREGQFLLSYRQLVDKVIVIYFFYGSVIQKMFVFTKAYVIFKSGRIDSCWRKTSNHMVLGNREQHGFEELQQTRRHACSTA